MKKHKIIALLIAVPAAILLWIYVVSTVSPETRGSVGGIPVSIEGNLVLEERGLVITEQFTESVSLELNTNRANFAKLSRENIRISADASKITEAGEYALSYTVSFPDTVNGNDIEIVHKSTETIRVNVAQVIRKTLEIELDWTGAVKEGYLFEAESVVPDPAEILLTGPDTEIEQVKRAVLQYDISGLEQTTIETLDILLLNEEGEQVELSDFCTVSAAQSSLTLPIQRTKQLKLTAELIPGGGVQEENAELRFTPETIQVKGTSSLVDMLSDEFSVGSIDLSTVLDDEMDFTFPLTLPVGVTCMSGEESVDAKLTISGVKTVSIPVTNIDLINEPEGFSVDVTSKMIYVNVRGSSAEVSAMTEQDIRVTVDLQGTTQTGAFTKTARVVVMNHPNVGVVGSVEVGLLVSDLTEE